MTSNLILAIQRAVDISGPVKKMDFCIQNIHENKNIGEIVSLWKEENSNICNLSPREVLNRIIISGIETENIELLSLMGKLCPNRFNSLSGRRFIERYMNDISCKNMAVCELMYNEFRVAPDIIEVMVMATRTDCPQIFRTLSGRWNLFISMPYNQKDWVEWY